mmetsp:Transcript_6565/g.11411  ORF Transcript_6565/g.11411 Transcript_6565/m.11411 type:complete len:242 (-) Transcript_6565:55-780(-)
MSINRGARVVLPLWLAVSLLLTENVGGKKTKEKEDPESTAKMQICFDLAISRAHRRASDIQKLFEALSELATGDMTNEEALETVMLGWMTQCHEAMEEIGSEMMAAANENATLYLELEEKLLGPLPKIADSDQGRQVFMEAMAFVMTQPKKLLKQAKKVMLQPSGKQAQNSTGNVSKSEDGRRKLWLQLSPASLAFSAIGLAFAGAAYAVYKLSRSHAQAATKTGGGKTNRSGKPRKTKVG